MNHRPTTRLIWLIALTLAAGQTSAYYTMSMTITPPDFRLSHQSTMTMELTNRGDETAYMGSAEIIYPKGLKADATLFERIDPNMTDKKTVNVTADWNMTPGTYPLIVSLQFHDKNNYPIYMIYEAKFNVKTHTTPKVHGVLSTTTFPPEGKGKLTFNLKNADETPHNVETRLILPQSLSTENGKNTVELAPHTEETIEFWVSNFMALPDSDLMVIGTAEYEEDGLHYSTTARGQVKIGGGVERPTIPLAAAALTVIAGALAYYYWPTSGEKQKLKKTRNLKVKNPLKYPPNIRR